MSALYSLLTYTTSLTPHVSTASIRQLFSRASTTTPAMSAVPITEQHVRGHFRPLCEEYDSATFFRGFVADVDCRIMGSHVEAGHFHSVTEWQSQPYRARPRLTGAVTFDIVSCIVSGRRAVVELQEHATLMNGKPFDNQHCWVLRYNDRGLADEVRLYMDGVMINTAIRENPLPGQPLMPGE